METLKTKKNIYSAAGASFPQEMFNRSWKLNISKKTLKILFTSSSILPQVLICLKSVQQIMKHMKISNKSWKNIFEAHLYTAAGAYLTKKCSTNHEIYGKLVKNEHHEKI